MFAPVYSVCKANAGVLALIPRGADGDIRLFAFGEADQATQKPYAVWQTVGGQPENYLGDLPDVDSFSLQIDVYAATANSARAVGQAIRDAVEPFAYVTGFNGEFRDTITRNYRYSFSVQWFVTRS